MHTPNKSEFVECNSIADSIVTHLKANNWNVRAPLPIRSFKSTRLVGVSITLGTVLGPYRNVGLINGSSGILIRVPDQGFLSSRVTPAELADLRRVIGGALVHECTHVIQKAVAPSTFAAALKLEATLHAPHNSQPDEWFDLYIGQPFEQEARAAQAAAEVETLAGPSISELSFQSQLPNTEVWKRTEARIGGPGSASAKVASWWAIWTALAWDAYAKR